jgi:curli production assembly/transport component CsgF
MNNYALGRVCIRTIVSLALFQQTAGASGLVYTPINPTFGGNPNNGPMLLSTAQAQNGFTAPKPAPLTPLQRFNNSLQQAILNNLASQIKTSLFGTDGTTITPGTYDAVNYTITVVQNADGSLTITTTDKTNGATATFDVSTAM